MQVDEVLAQDSRCEASSVHPSSLKTTTSVALEKGTTRRTSLSLRSGEQVVVLLVRKAH